MRRIFRSEYFLISVMLLIALAIGMMTFRDYGESYDESEIFWYGNYSLTSYSTKWMGQPVRDFELPTLNYYGPAYFMIASSLSTLERAVVHDLTLAQAWNFLNFITFLVGCFALYILARRWFRRPVALGTTLLYMTQPLLWGHAFINPKDIPFATFFLVSIVSGLWMIDTIFTPKKSSQLTISLLNGMRRLIQAGESFLHSKKARAIAVLWVISIIVLWLFNDSFDQFITFFITRLYSSSPDSFWGSLFALFASNSSKILASSYVHKTFVLFSNFRIVITVIGACFGIASLYLVFPYRIKFSETVREFTTEIFSNLANPSILIAGIILGLTTSIRVLGPLAGLIVVVYALVQYRRKAIVPLLGYGIAAILIMYLTWPFLWNAPFERFYATLTTMSSYPWAGQVFFNGSYYLVPNLPWSYLPVLLSIQLTEPAILLFWIGCVLLARKLKRRLDADLIIILTIWFFIPLLGLIITHRPLYDNFRQLLFLLPPVFLLCGLALEFIFQYIHGLAWKAIFLFLISLPGIYSIYYLHPYQYIYYNAVLGGFGNAYRSFETDYWLISYKQAVDFLNVYAPQGATIIVPLGFHLVHTRSDLVVKQSLNSTSEKYDFVLLNSRLNGLAAFPQDRVVLSIERNGAILAQVKQASKIHSAN